MEGLMSVHGDSDFSRRALAVEIIVDENIHHRKVGITGWICKGEGEGMAEPGTRAGADGGGCDRWSGDAQEQGACYLALAPTSATNGYLYLVDDAGDGGYAPGSPIALSSGGTLQNSQCTINTAGSSASASGNTLTLNLAMTFNPSFAGNQVFYLAARNHTTGNSGWQAVGSVTVP